MAPDSCLYVPEPELCGTFDLVFIDAGHEEKPFYADCETAWLLCSPGSIIAWHDCGNPEFPHIEEFLVGRAVWVNGTGLAIETANLG